MQRLPMEAWTAILCITAGPLDDLDEMTGAEGDVSSWRTCLCVEIVSKGVRQHVHPCIVQMQVCHPRQLLILAWKMRREIKMEVDVEQLDSKPWSLDSRKCAMRKCNQRTGIFVPWHAGNDEYHTGDSSYSGPLSTRGETSMCSIYGPGRIDDYINGRGPHLVVCSFGCLQKIKRLIAFWPSHTGEDAWRILRGTEPFLEDAASRLRNEALRRQYEYEYGVTIQMTIPRHVG